MKIRKAKLVDVKEISGLRKQTLKKVNSLEYKKEVIDYLVIKNSTKNILRKMKKRDFYVAIENNKVIGTIDLTIDHIGGLFVKHNMLGKGIGKKLLLYVEKKAKRKGIIKVNLNPTKSAIPFYKKHGYKLIKSHTWKTDTFKTKAWTMEKKLK